MLKDRSIDSKCATKVALAWQIFFGHINTNIRMSTSFRMRVTQFYITN